MIVQNSCNLQLLTFIFKFAEESHMHLTSEKKKICLDINTICTTTNNIQIDVGLTFEAFTVLENKTRIVSRRNFQASSVEFCSLLIAILLYYFLSCSVSRYRFVSLSFLSEMVRTS